MFAPSISLKSACRPFLARTFRGSRLRVAVLLSTVLAAVTVLLGFGVAQGDGPFEEGLRTDFGLERGRWERRYTEFVIVVDTAEEAQYGLEVRARLEREGPQVPQAEDDPAFDFYPSSDVEELARNGWLFVRAAAATAIPVSPNSFPWGVLLSTRSPQQLQAEARQLLAARESWSWPPRKYEDDTTHFSWTESADIERLQSTLDAELLPAIELYESPLGLRETFGVVALFAATVCLGCMLVVAPLLAAVQVAQEVHENTLSPLVGTSLSPGALALGLSSAPLALAGLYAAPHLAILLVCVPFAVHPLAGLVGLVATLVTSVGLVMLAQVAGLAMGRRRGPGLVAIALIGILGLAMLVSFVLALSLKTDGLVGMLAYVPQVGPIYAFLLAFQPAGDISVTLPAWAPLLLGVAIFAGVAVLAHRAFARRIEGRAQASLSPLEHAFATGIVVLMTLSVFGWVDIDRGDRQLWIGALLFLLPPLALLVTARAPLGTQTPRPRWIGPAARAYAAGLALHIGGMALLHGDLRPSLPAAFHGLWIVGMTFAIACLVATKPLNVGRSVLLMLSVIALWGEAGSALFRSDVPIYFPIQLTSPTLALFQAGMLITLPLVYVRELWERQRTSSSDAASP